MVSDAFSSYNFKNISTPIVSALSDVSFLIFIGGLIGISLDSSLRGTAWRTATKLLDVEGYADWLEAQNIAGAIAGGAKGARFGWVGLITGALAGSFGVEIGEDVVQELAEVPSSINSNLIQLQLFWGIENLKEETRTSVL
jgi:hypothetical protein